MSFECSRLWMWMLFQCRGPSMQPTINELDVILTDSISVNKRAIKRLAWFINYETVNTVIIIVN